MTLPIEIKNKVQLEQASASMLEEGGPVVVGIAVTNIPHLPLPELSVIEKEGQEFVRVPFLRKGVFRHPSGDLVFNDEIMDKMVENHNKKRSHYGVMLNEAHQPRKALAWFDKKAGGWIQKESDPEFGEILVGYGKPTGNTIVDLIRSQEYRFASVEFKPKFKNTMIAKLSSDDLTYVDEEELSRIMLEEEMENVTISLEEYNTLKEKAAKAEKITQLEAALEAAEAKVTELETPKEDNTIKFENLPEEFRLQFEEMRADNVRLKKNALQKDVDLVITRAESYRDGNGKGHSPVLLEIAKAAMLGEPVNLSQDSIVKLESSAASGVADYFRKVIVGILENVPGQINFSTKTEADEARSVDNGNDTQAYSDGDFKAFWAEAY